MVDDIVTRLRAAARTGDLPLGASFNCDAVADEIERLREIAEAADQYHDVACDPEWCRLCRALDAWKEARRG